MAHAKDSLLLYGHQSGIVQSGIVYYKPPRLCLQPWSGGCIKKYRCELQRESSHHPRQLLLVETPKGITEDAETIPLENVFKVTPKEGLVKGKSIFQIMTSNGKFTLGTDSLKETEKWIHALNEELFGPPKHHVVYEYRVKVRKSYKGEMSYGDYLLRVYNREIRLFTPNGLIPTKFKCIIRDIYKVKHHSFGELRDCVTISVKNTQTNNKEIDILILNTKSALDVEKVIRYRKKHLDLQDELDVETVGNDRDSSVAVEQLQGCFDELQQKLQRVNISSEGTVSTAASNPVVSHQQKENFHDCSEKEQILTISNVADNSDITSELPQEVPIGRERYRSLPLIYNITTNPSIDDQDGVVWNDGFDLRAPKRKKAVKGKQTSQTLPRQSSYDRPPASLPEDAEISNQEDQEDNQDYATIHSFLASDRKLRTSLVYDSVNTKPHTIPRLKDANAALTGPTQPMRYQKFDSDKEYVINSIQQTYLKVLSPEEEGAFVFIPLDISKKFN